MFPIKSLAFTIAFIPRRKKTHRHTRQWTHLLSSWPTTTTATRNPRWWRPLRCWSSIALVPVLARSSSTSPPRAWWRPLSEQPHNGDTTTEKVAHAFARGVAPQRRASGAGLRAGGSATSASSRRGGRAASVKSSQRRSNNSLPLFSCPSSCFPRRPSD